MSPPFHIKPRAVFLIGLACIGSFVLGYILRDLRRSGNLETRSPEVASVSAEFRANSEESDARAQNRGIDSEKRSVLSAVRRFRETDPNQFELESMPREARDSLIDEAVGNCMEEFEALRGYEVENLEVIAKSEDGGTLISKIPRPPQALYDSIMERGLLYCAGEHPFSIESLAAIERELQERMHLYETNQYFVAQTGAGSDTIGVMGYYTNVDMKIGLEYDADGTHRIVTRNGDGRTYWMTSDQPEFDSRLGHLFSTR